MKEMKQYEINVKLLSGTINGQSVDYFEITLVLSSGATIYLKPVDRTSKGLLLEDYNK